MVYLRFNRETASFKLLLDLHWDKSSRGIRLHLTFDLSVKLDEVRLLIQPNKGVTGALVCVFVVVYGTEVLWVLGPLRTSLENVTLLRIFDLMVPGGSCICIYVKAIIKK